MERLVTSHVVDAVAVVTNVLGPSRVEDDRGPSRTLHDGLAARVGRQRVCLVDDDLAPDELAALYGAATLVVGERFHSVLLALAAGTPAYAISYFTNKAEGMMQDLQLGEFHCRLGDVDGADIHMRSVQLVTPATRRRVHKAVGGARDALEAVMV
jgi:colanic acid/amylovoran biosynthesis protein